MSGRANFEGLPARTCGEHRTVGPHRAWCYDCREWCYPRLPCGGCAEYATTAPDLSDIPRSHRGRLADYVDVFAARNAAHVSDAYLRGLRAAALLVRAGDEPWRAWVPDVARRLGDELHTDTREAIRARLRDDQNGSV